MNLINEMSQNREKLTKTFQLHAKAILLLMVNCLKHIFKLQSKYRIT